MTSASRRPVVNIDLARIVSRDRLRKFRPAAVEALAESIKAQGQLQPILVQRCGADFVLIAGRHRLQAVRQLGHDTIRVEIADNLDADQALFIEIDENLIRADLSQAERALHISKRKELYERAHPETRHGAAGRGREKSCQVGDSNDRFTKDTAAKTGQSERNVQRDAARGEKVAVLPEIVGTSLDKGAELDALAKLSEAEQRELAESAKAGETVSARKGTPKLERAAAKSVLLTAWQTASAAERTQVLEHEGVGGLLELLTKAMRAELLDHAARQIAFKEKLARGSKKKKKGRR